MRLDAMYMVQHKLRVSLVPYLSRLAILTSQGSRVDFESKTSPYLHACANIAFGLAQ